MQIESLQGNSSNITLPLNHSVQQSNGAQFALMLSLLYESRVEQAGASNNFQSQFALMTEAGADNSRLFTPEFNLETSLTRALQNNQQPHFYLLHSLYAERSIQIDGALQASATNHVAIAEGVLKAVDQGQGNAKIFREAERVNLATPARAA